MSFYEFVRILNEIDYFNISFDKNEILLMIGEHELPIVIHKEPVWDVDVMESKQKITADFRSELASGDICSGDIATIDKIVTLIEDNAEIFEPFFIY